MLRHNNTLLLTLLVALLSLATINAKTAIRGSKRVAAPDSFGMMRQLQVTALKKSEDKEEKTDAPVAAEEKKDVPEEDEDEDDEDEDEDEDDKDKDKEKEEKTKEPQVLEAEGDEPEEAEEEMEPETEEPEEPETEEPKEPETEEPEETDAPKEDKKQKEDDDEEEEPAVDDEQGGDILGGMEVTSDPAETEEPVVDTTAAPVAATTTDTTEAPVATTTTITDAPVVAPTAPAEEETTTTTETETMGEIVETAAPTPAIAEGEQFFQPISPFSVVVDGDVEAEDLQLDLYLEQHMKQAMPNLINVALTSQEVVDGELVDDDEEEAAGNMTESNSTRVRRSLTTLHLASVTRLLMEKTFYYQGTALFEGPPYRTTEELDAALEAALADEDAIAAFLKDSPAIAADEDVAITSAKPDDSFSNKTTSSATSEQESSSSSSDSTLTTTGMTIVIVAACVGGLSLLIVFFVGVSGPSGTPKKGLPEQPR